MDTLTYLKKKSAEIRLNLLEMIYQAKSGHTGGALSSVDILTVLYYAVMNITPDNPKNPSRDRFVMSKGHSVEGVYNILADKGFFDKSELRNFSKFKSRLIGHPSVKVPGIELNTGALGHGLSCSVGMALAAKKYVKEVRVYCLMGDGEQAEGSVWEAGMAASNYKLDNLTAVIDRNYLQISGNTEDVMRLDSLTDKWKAFGWEVMEVDGHNIEQLLEVLEKPRIPDKPTILIAKTTKGKGVTYMEDMAKWHHGVPTEEQYKQAVDEIKKYIRELDDHE
ncbi:MAG: transketolase [Spirochaetes bacterium]|nr:transketolase [Spirochaetota bacterium]MBL7005715.1 transketolase [Spirochaetia bacterium]